jgi:CRP/FNR family transcriptional regulator, anaerobic regulatory protein
MTGRARTDRALVPAIAAIPLRGGSQGRAVNILSDPERQRLGAMASPLRVSKGEIIYREGAAAEFLYCVAEGVAMTTTAAPQAGSRVTAFAFAQDVFGLSTEGAYVESAHAATAAVLFRLPIARLEAALREDAGLAMSFICKLCDDLRERTRLSGMLARKDALGRAAMFVEALERRQRRDGAAPGILMPMRRTDVANHLGLTLEALSRAFAELIRLGVLTFRSKRQLAIIDRAALRSVIASTNRKAGAART